MKGTGTIPHKPGLHALNCEIAIPDIGVGLEDLMPEPEGVQARNGIKWMVHLVDDDILLVSIVQLEIPNRDIGIRLMPGPDVPVLVKDPGYVVEP